MGSEGDEYLSLYPKLRKWVNKCVMCHSKGYNPDMPEDIYPRPSFAAKNLRFFFRAMEVNEDGLCEVCSKALKKKETD
ncbi:hypothetical protein GTO89_06210 [Heliobacterium gestii]|uniref:Uncharacterized protein n=1 Tax=Heliomicrobium gestii TaxID=2699 RepID=A0A845LAN4_HELGE|nr:hypothetical protein [Heliomicrobium gestii]MBM7866037.1 hypothetical protein [Heliomicrobium gestii]MZP42631.1 hypothetical protein [Heliomicrobium gestii]